MELNKGPVQTQSTEGLAGVQQWLKMLYFYFMDLDSVICFDCLWNCLTSCANQQLCFTEVRRNI